MYCEKCGSKLQDNAKFCTKCGAVQNLEERASPVPEKKKGKRLFLIFLIPLLAIIVVLAAIFAPTLMEHIEKKPASEKSGTQWGKERERETEDEDDENEEYETEAEEPDAVSEMVEESTFAETFPTDNNANTNAAAAPSESLSTVITPDMVQWRLMETPANLAGYRKMTILQSGSSSTITQQGYQNGPEMAVDGNELTSWQEGVEGSGIGESVYYMFDNKYNLSFITLNLGNWRNDRLYQENNRPKEMTISINDYVFQVPFPDEKREFVLALDPAYAAEYVRFQIDGVYRGTKYDDTCIAEIGFYGTLAE